MRLFFPRLDKKHNLLESFEKTFENFLKKIGRNALFLHIFQRNLTKHLLIFMRVWTNNANCWEILRRFWKFFDENSIEKLNFYFIFYFILFYFIFRKFVTKNRAFGNNTRFLQQFFFGFGGGGFPPSPHATPLQSSNP